MDNVRRAVKDMKRALRVSLSAFGEALSRAEGILRVIDRLLVLADSDEGSDVENAYGIDFNTACS